MTDVSKIKLSFDPVRTKQRAIHEDAKELFHDYSVFEGGSSSFDTPPTPYNKAMRLHNIVRKYKQYRN